MHVLDFLHVVFVVCCCNQSEAFKMNMGQSVSLHISSWKEFSFGNLIQMHSWATSLMSVVSSTAMLKQGAACRSANNWSGMSFPMSSIHLIIVESDSCNPVLFNGHVLVVKFCKHFFCWSQKAVFYHFWVWEKFFFLPVPKSTLFHKMLLLNTLHWRLSGG